MIGAEDDDRIRPRFSQPPAHFRNAVGRKVAVRTDHELAGRKRFRGTVADAGNDTLALEVAGGERVSIPYAAIVRGNLIDEVN